MNSNKPYIDHGVKWGVILGLSVGIVLNSIAFISMDLLFNQWFGIVLGVVNITVFILVMVYVGKKARAFTGYITINQAFITLFFTALLHVLITTGLGLVTDTVTKDKKQAKLAEIKENAIADMEERGMDEEEIEKSMKMMDRFSSQGIGAQALWMVLRLAVDVLIAYIIAASIKRSPPTPIIPEAETT